MTASAPHWNPWPRDRLLRWAGFALALIGVLAWSFMVISEATIWAFVLDAPQQGRDLFGRMIPPDLGFARELGRPLLETLHMATLGTLLAMVLAVPLAFAAAENTSPPIPGLRWLALLLIVASRSVNSLIWALLLVIILGPGVVAGIVAIALRSVGFIGKLLYEAIEESSPKPVEAMRSLGASPMQERVYAVWPSVLPAFVGIVVYRWDINIREASILGLVGAGGLGLALIGAIDTLAWGRVGTLFLVILATVLFSEWLSARIRAKVT